MAAPLLSRLQHMLEAARHIEQLVDGKTISDSEEDRVKSAALERFIEIISEASRHIPDGVKARHPEVTWPDVAAIGTSFGPSTTASTFASSGKLPSTIFRS